MSENHTPHPKNVPGPFYVVKGCCTACMVPHAVAPALMGFDEKERHCFVERQPQTLKEINQAIRAIWSSELGCLRYAGGDPATLRRLAEMRAADACDQSPPPGSAPLLRNHVTFEAGPVMGAWDIAVALRQYLVERGNEATSAVQDGERATFSYSWVEGNYYALWVGRGEPSTNRWLICHSPRRREGSLGVSLVVDDWLRGEKRFGGIRWYTAEAWANSRAAEWQEMPY